MTRGYYNEVDVVVVGLRKNLWLLGVALFAPVFGPIIPCNQACAQGPSASQLIAASSPILDETGVRLSGNSPDVPRYGHLHIQGDLVQFLEAPDGIIYPPAVDGNPDPRNSLMGISQIGLGVSAMHEQPATFTGLLSPRPPAGKKFFARVFNSPEAGESSFYADSEIFTVRAYVNEVFWPRFSPTDLPVDPNDDDADGLNNSRERSLGTDKTSADSDGDGFSDGEEFVTRTDALDADSKLTIVKVSWGGGDDALLRWDSAESVMYRLECQDLGQEHYRTLATVQGEAGETSLLVQDGMLMPARNYRIMALGP